MSTNILFPGVNLNPNMFAIDDVFCLPVEIEEIIVDNKSSPATETHIIIVAKNPMTKPNIKASNIPNI